MNTTTTNATFVQVWQDRVRTTFRGPLIHHAARILANDLRQTGTRSVDLDPDAVRRLLLGLHLLRPPALRRLLARLTEAGLLSQTRAADGGHWGSYHLTLPATSPPRPSG
jgi:hypothetical protein